MKREERAEREERTERFDIYIHTDSSKLDKIIELLHKVINKEQRIMATLDETLEDVKQEATVGDSLIALTTSLKASLDAVLAGQLPPAAQAKVDAIFAAVEANKTKYADAIVANTPAA